MENARNTEANTASAQSCCAPGANSGWLSPRNLLIGVTVAGGAAAMFFGWDWLVAAGLATFIIALAPCAVMCGLGLCASRMGKKDAGTSAQAIPPKEAQLPAAGTVANAQPAAEMVATVEPAVVEEAKSA
jgi:hypothetical protein